MASPVSLGDIVIVSQFAWNVCLACRDAGTEYEDLAELCSKIHLAIDLCRPNERTSVLRQQESEAIEVLATGITTTLTRLETILGRYSGIGKPGVRSFPGRISFSFFTSSNRNDIKQNLRDHLQLLTTILQGSSLNLQNVAVSLILELVVEKRKAGDKNLDNQTIKTDSTVVEGLIQELGITDGDTKEKLLKDRGIGEQIVRADHEREKAAKSAAKPGKLDSPITLLERPGHFNAPAATKTEGFEPASLQWFANIQGFFNGVTVLNAFDPIPWLSADPPSIQYSQQDEWHCPFQEGWTLNRTIAERLGQSEQAFYFSYNGLSCQTGRLPMTSRLYFRLSPLIPDNRDNKVFPLQRGSNGVIKFEVTEAFSKGLSRFWRTYNSIPSPELGPVFPQPGPQPYGYPPLQPGAISQPVFSPQYGPPPPFGYSGPPQPPVPPVTTYIGYYMGYKFRDDLIAPTNQWRGPFDLSDELTALFVYFHYGSAGTNPIQRDKIIDDSLPSGWAWKRDITGAGRHIYVYLGDGERMETTVHPSRFYCEGDDIKLIKLPGRWERRLDRDGGLFFVDHHTRTATRLNPCLNRDIGRDTGLPKPWKHIIDSDKRDYYFCHQGDTTIGTPHGARINSKSLAGKEFLTREPRTNDDIKALRSEVGVTHTFLGIAEIAAPKMQPEEEARYFALFRDAEKQSPYKLTWPEAVAHIQSSGLHPTVYIPILNTADANLDGVFTPREYAGALHKLRYALRRWQGDQAVQPAGEDEVRGYEKAFVKFKTEGALEITLKEALRASEESFFELPSKVAVRVWKGCDGSRVGSLDVVQFCEGCHRLKTELNHRRALAKIGGEPLRVREGGAADEAVVGDEGGDEEAVGDEEAAASTPPLDGDPTARDGSPAQSNAPVLLATDPTTIPDPSESTPNLPTGVQKLSPHTAEAPAGESPVEDVGGVVKTAAGARDEVGEVRGGL